MSGSRLARPRHSTAGTQLGPTLGKVPRINERRWRRRLHQLIKMWFSCSGPPSSRAAPLSGQRPALQVTNAHLAQLCQLFVFLSSAKFPLALYKSHSQTGFAVQKQIVQRVFPANCSANRSANRSTNHLANRSVFDARTVSRCPFCFLIQHF